MEGPLENSLQNCLSLNLSLEGTLRPQTRVVNWVGVVSGIQQFLPTRQEPFKILNWEIPDRFPRGGSTGGCVFCMCVIGLGVMGWDGLITRLGQLSSANHNCGWYDRKQRGLPSIITSVHIIDDIILLQTITRLCEHTLLTVWLSYF